MPKAPKTSEFFLNMFGMDNIMNTFGKSLNEGRAFYVDTVIEEDFSYTKFQSKGLCEIVDKLPMAQRKFLLYGTFKSCPQGSYEQLLKIYLEYYDHVRLFYLFPYSAKKDEPSLTNLIISFCYQSGLPSLLCFNG